MLKRFWRLTASIGLLGALLVVGAITAATPANAAALTNVISNIRITQPTDQIDVWESVRIEADWSVTDPQEGDTFSMTLPAEFGSNVLSFAVEDSDDPSVILANCTVTNTPTAPVMTCSLTAAAAARDSIQDGGLWLTATARRATTATQVEFTVDNKPVLVTLPGTGIIDPGPWMPTELAKQSWIDQANGLLVWRVRWPGNQVSGDSVTISDELNVNPPEWEAQVGFSTVGYLEEWNGTDFTTVQEVPLTWTDGGTKFEVTLNYDFKADGNYGFRYATIPVGDAAYQDVYRNTATALGQTVDHEMVWTASGGGSGRSLGRFSLTKTVTGEAESLVPEDTDYTIHYTTASGGTGELTFKEGTLVYSPRVAGGTAITITEVELPEIAGVDWGTPTFSGEGITKNADGSVTISPAAGQVVALTLNNIAQAEPTPMGMFSVLKKLEGSGSAMVPVDTEFNVNYTYTEGSETKTGVLQVKADGSAVYSEDLPDGTVITLSEPELPEIAGISWGKPVFSGDRVTVVDGQATITVSSEATVEESMVFLTNTATKVVVPSESTKPEPTPTPTVTSSQPVTPGDLPKTDASGGIAIALVGVVGLAVAAAALSQRRRVTK